MCVCVPRVYIIGVKEETLAPTDHGIKGRILLRYSHAAGLVNSLFYLPCGGRSGVVFTLLVCVPAVCFLSVFQSQLRSLVTEYK